MKYFRYLLFLVGCLVSFMRAPMPSFNGEGSLQADMAPQPATAYDPQAIYLFRGPNTMYEVSGVALQDPSYARELESTGELKRLPDGGHASMPPSVSPPIQVKSEVVKPVVKPAAIAQHKRPAKTHTKQRAVASRSMARAKALPPKKARSVASAQASVRAVKTTSKRIPPPKKKK